MEEKKNSRLYWVIGILLVLVLALGGFIVYDKVLNKPVNNTERNYNYKLSDKKNIQLLGGGICSYNWSVLTDKKGDAYLDVHRVNSGCDSTDSEKENANKVISMMTENKVSGIPDNDYFDSDYFDSVKLNVSNVLTMYMANFGQDGNEYIFFIKDNGKVSYLRANDIFEKGEVSVKSIEDISNVVSIFCHHGFFGSGAYAITMDGKEINLINYLEEYKR